MDYVTNGARTFKRLGIAVLLAGGITTLGSVFNGVSKLSGATQKHETSVRHHVLSPHAELHSVACAGCEAEAAAYAVTLANLEAARKAADEAYDAWYDCVYPDGPGPAPGQDSQPDTPQLASILEQ